MGPGHFTDVDLRIMIEQRVALSRLVPLALARLGSDRLAQGDPFPGDLLARVLRVETIFWEQFPDLDVSLCRLVEELSGPLALDAELRRLIEAFTREHSVRRQRFRAT